jgi:hypothetical protein
MRRFTCLRGATLFVLAGVGGCGSTASTSDALNGLLTASDVDRVVISMEQTPEGYGPLTNAELPRSWNALILGELVPCKEWTGNTTDDFGRFATLNVVRVDGTMITLHLYATGTQPLGLSYKGTLFYAEHDTKGKHTYLVFQDLVRAAFDADHAAIVSRWRHEDGLSPLPLGEPRAVKKQE